MNYTEKEIEHIKALNWDKGWRSGLLAATIFYSLIALLIISL